MSKTLEIPLSLNRRSQEIMDQEGALRLAWRNLALSPYGVVQDIESALDRISLNAKEHAELRKAAGRRVSEALTEKLAPVAKVVSGAIGEWSRFQAQYDALDISKNNYLVDRMVLLVREIERRAGPHLSRSRRRKLQSLRCNLEASYRKHIAQHLTLHRNRAYYFAMIDFLGELDPFFQTAGKLTRTPGEYRDVVREKRMRFAAGGRFCLSLLRMLLPTLKISATKAPLTGLMRPHLDRIYSARGLTMVVLGEVNVPRATEPGIIHLLPQMHTSIGELDIWASSTLELAGTTFMWDLTRNSMTRLLASHPDILPVTLRGSRQGAMRSGKRGGSWGNPFTRLFKQIQAGQTHSLLVFPEANISPSLTGGIRPVQQAFTIITLGRILRKGYGITLTPIASPYHHRSRATLGYSQDATKLFSVVSPTISASVVDAVVATSGLTAVGTLIRQIWLMEAVAKPLSHDHVAGTLPLERAEGRLLDNVAEINHCRSLFAWMKSNPGY